MPPANDFPPRQRTTDIVVIGDGIVGLSTALELARRGARTVVLGSERAGNASLAAAGLLAPSIGQLSAAARAFYEASLRLFPALLASLSDLDEELGLIEGLLVVGEGLGGHGAGAGGQPLSAEETRRLEPGVDAPNGATFYQSDGAVDNVRLMRALRGAADQHPEIELVSRAPVSSIALSPGHVTVSSQSGIQVAAPRVILAAGAWSPQLDGLPRPVPVFPLKGQMLALDSCPIRHAVVGNGVYVVPRGYETVIGSTSERAGFDLSTTTPAVEGLRSAATALCPGLATSKSARAWAGLRPATPDMLPILGPDPDHPELLYATGHSRNGILLAPATAQVLADLATGNQPTLDISGFGIARFDASPGSTNLIPDA